MDDPVQCCRFPSKRIGRKRDASLTEQGDGIMSKSDSDSIAEKVRFWEEQDKINQELIPRIIRQNKLLTKHIAEHDSLPEVAANTISKALAAARAEQSQQYDNALEGAKSELADQAQASVNQGLASLHEEYHKFRNMHIGITSLAGAICLVVLLVNFLT